MAEGERPGPADPTANHADSWWLTKIEHELTSIVERMESEMADRHTLTTKSASALHDLRLAAERFAREREHAG